MILFADRKELFLFFKPLLISSAQLTAPACLLIALMKARRARGYGRVGFFINFLESFFGMADLEVLHECKANIG